MIRATAPACLRSRKLVEQSASGSSESSPRPRHVGIAEARDRGRVGNPRGLIPRTLGLARGQPGVGAHLAGAAPGVDPHCPGAGRLTFVPRFNVFLPPTLVTMRLPCSHKRECTGCSKNCEHGRRRYFCKDCGGKGICEHGRRRSRCKDCGGSSSPASASTAACATSARSAAVPAYASTGGGATAARSAAAAASASTGGVAAIARSAACGLMNPRAWRTSSATLVACVKYASVCVSPGGRNSHGRRPARGRPGVGPH